MVIRLTNTNAKANRKTKAEKKREEKLAKRAHGSKPLLRKMSDSNTLTY